MTTEIERSKHSRKKNIIRLSFFIIYIIVLFLIYFYLTKWGINPFITIFLLLFLFLITIGIVLRRTKGSLYSRIFPDKKRRSSINKVKDEKKMHKFGKESRRLAQQHDMRKIFKEITNTYKELIKYKK